MTPTKTQQGKVHMAAVGKPSSYERSADRWHIR